MKFTHTVYNYGSGYDHSTGVFTAPVNGTYLFTTKLCAKLHNSIYYGIYVDSVPITNSTVHGSRAYTCNTLDAIVVLNATNKVWVQSIHSTGTFHTDLFRWNTFSGVLLNKSL